MEITESILTSLLLVFFIFIFNYKSRKPRLTMECKIGACGSGSDRIVEYIKDKEENEGFDRKKSIHIMVYEWNIKLIIRNAGELDAHSVELFFHNLSPVVNLQPQLNKLVPIRKDNEIQSSTKYFLKKRIAMKDRGSCSKMIPHVFKDLKLMLKYKDKFGVVNYTKYDFSTKKNSYRVLFRFTKFRSKNLGQIPEGFLP